LKIWTDLSSVLSQFTRLTDGRTDGRMGRPSYGGNDVRCVIEISGAGRKKLLEILYNVMQRPVGHDQRAYSTNML